MTILVQTWFIHQAKLRFPLSQLLNKVVALCRRTFMQISVNFIRTVLVVDVLMRREGKDFTIEDLLHVYCVVQPRRNPETYLYEGNH